MDIDGISSLTIVSGDITDNEASSGILFEGFGDGDINIQYFRFLRNNFQENGGILTRFVDFVNADIANSSIPKLIFQTSQNLNVLLIQHCQSLCVSVPFPFCYIFLASNLFVHLIPVSISYTLDRHILVC